MTGAWLVERLILLIPLLLSLSVHEWAHARAAFALGDPTAKLLGRLSLDPLVHLDLVGSVLLPLLGVPFGWAKPVPVSPMRFSPAWDGRVAMMLTAAAGPASNVGIAVVVWVGWWAGLGLGLMRPEDTFSRVFESTIQLNLSLAIFNLLPIPPLDGSRVVDGLIPTSLRPVWDRLGVLGPGLIMLFLVLSGVLGMLPSLPDLTPR